MKRQAFAPVLSHFIVDVLSPFILSVLSLCILAALPLPLLASPSLHPQKVIPLWPQGTPEPPQTTAPEMDATEPTDHLISGHRTRRLTNITTPTLTIFQPQRTTPEPHAAIVVFPGGGYRILAWDGEGLDACRWVNSIGMSCLLVKYRVPEQGRYPENPADLEDAQQAMRIARQHASAWHINPHKIGVLGFSAGANLAVLLSTHWDDHHINSTPAAKQVDSALGAHPDFAILAYPAYLAQAPDKTTLAPVYTPRPSTPPTFLIQAENDHTYIDSSLVYFRALKDAGIPAELHIYATGGHGFGMHPIGAPEEHWTQLVTAWLRSIHMLPVPSTEANSWQPPTGPAPCPTQEATMGRPSKNPQTSDNPACW